MKGMEQGLYEGGGGCGGAGALSGDEKETAFRGSERLVAQTHNPEATAGLWQSQMPEGTVTP